MKTEDFVAAVKANVVDENVETYEHLFSTTDRNGVTDPYWARALALYDELDSDARRVLLEAVRQVVIDTVSNVLGVLDGSSTLAGYDVNFSLRTVPDGGENMAGYLQDAFLALVEQEAHDEGDRH